MNPAWLSFRTSAGGRPKVSSDLPANIPASHLVWIFWRQRLPSGTGAFLGALRSFDSLLPRAFKLALSTCIRSTTLLTAVGDGRFGKGHFLAFHLPLDRSLHPGAMLVNVFIGVKRLTASCSINWFANLSSASETGAASTPSSLIVRTSALKWSWCMASPSSIGRRITMCSLPREIHLPTAHCLAFLSATANRE